MPPELASRLETPAAGSRLTDGGSRLAGPSSRSPRRQSDRSEADDLAGVDRILANDGISNQQAALQLRELAMDRNLPTEERLEALQHGLNLGIDSFAGFAEQADLPTELASHYLHEIINYNDSPATQISAYISLIGHSDKEVSELAREMLSFQLGDDLQAEDDIQKADQEKLIQLGRRKLSELAKDTAQ